MYHVGGMNATRNSTIRGIIDGKDKLGKGKEATLIVYQEIASIIMMQATN